MSEVQNICKSIEENYLNKDEISKEEKVLYYSLGNRLMYELNFGNELIKKEDLNLVIDITRRACNKEKNISKYLEEEILNAVRRFTNNFVDGILSIKKERVELTERLLDRTNTEKEKREIEISFDLMNLAYELIGITKNRDSFSGKRKGYGTSILTYLNRRYKIVDLESLFISNLGYKSMDLLIETLASIQEYYKEPEKEVNTKVIELIEKRANKAKKRSELVSCLQTLIELNEIGELEAMDRVDKWKEKNYY